MEFTSFTVSSFSLLLVYPKLDELMLDTLETELLKEFEFVTHLVDEETLVLKELESRVESGSSTSFDVSTLETTFLLTGCWSGIFRSSLTISSSYLAQWDLNTNLC